MANDLIDPRRPNWTIPPRSPESLRAGANLPAVSTRPNFTMPNSGIGTGARQPFDIEMPTTRAPRPLALPAPAAPVAPAVPGAPGGQSMAYRAGQAVRSLPGVETALGAGGAALKGAKIIAKPAAVAGVVENFNDYKIDDREVDSTAKGTFNALRNGDFDMVGRSLSKGALETMMDLGSGVANTLDYVMPGKAPVSTAYNQKLREQFGSLLVDNTPKPDAGAGRGYVNPSLPRSAPTIAAPTSSNLASGADYSNEGRNYPARSAPDLTGKIVKSTDANGNAVYTGSNIKAGADIVDRDGKLLNTDDPNNPAWRSSTGVSVAGPGGGGRSPMDIYANTSRINGQISETARALDAYGPGGGGGINGNGLFDSLRATQSAGRPTTRTERMGQAELASREQLAAAQNAATLRGQDIGASTARYGADTSRANTRDSISATLRGQDMDYAEKLDSKRLDLAARQAQRAMMAEAWKGTTDPLVAAQRYAAAGGDPSTMLAVAGGQRAAAEASATALDRNLAFVAASVDKDGKGYIDPAKLATARKTAQGVVPGYATDSPTGQIAGQPQGLGPVAAIEGMNTLRGDTLMNRIFPSGTPPAMTTLPDLNGAQYDPLGFTDVTPWSKRSMGDMRVRLRDGTDQYIPKSLVNEDVLDTLKRNGAKQGN